MGVYGIKAIKYCEQSTPGPEMYLFSHWDEWIDVYFYFFVLRGKHGRVCLVDTGVRDVEEVNPGVIAGVGERGRFRMNMQTENIPLLLEKEGIDPQKVEYVFLTHLHYDHCSNIKLFPNAKFVLSRRGWKQTLDCDIPEMLPDPVFPKDVLAYLAGEAKERLILAEDDQEIIPGISCFYTGGHTLCGQAVKVATESGMAIITGDVAFLYGNIELNHPVGLITNVQECYRAMKRIRQEADIVIPMHDPEIITRYPGGMIAG